MSIEKLPEPEASKEKKFCDNLISYVKLLNTPMHPDEVATTQRKVLEAVIQNLIHLYYVPEEKKDEEPAND